MRNLGKRKLIIEISTEELPVKTLETLSDLLRGEIEDVLNDVTEYSEDDDFAARLNADDTLSINYRIEMEDN